MRRCEWVLSAGLEPYERPRGRTPPWMLAETGPGRRIINSGLFKVWRLDLVVRSCILAVSGGGLG